MSRFFEVDAATQSVRYRRDCLFEWACFSAASLGILLLAILLVAIGVRAWGWLDGGFLASYDSMKPEKAGILAALWGSFWLALLTAVLSIPVGVGAAVYLEEYASDSWIRRFIQLNLSNLAGVPSIVYGILGMSVFVHMFRAFDGAGKAIVLGTDSFHVSIPLPFGPSIISGACTLSLLVLPVIIVSTQEALRAIPPSIRHASLALGATRWQTVRRQVLPAAVPGILTGVILSVSRAIGETAPLIMVGAATYVAFSPGSIETPAEIFSNPQAAAQVPFEQDGFTTLPIQIYNWMSRPDVEFQQVAAAGILVLLALLLAMNSLAILTRQDSRQHNQW